MKKQKKHRKRILKLVGDASVTRRGFKTRSIAWKKKVVQSFEKKHASGINFVLFKARVLKQEKWKGNRIAVRLLQASDELVWKQDLDTYLTELFTRKCSDRKSQFLIFYGFINKTGLPTPIIDTTSPKQAGQIIRNRGHLEVQASVN